ncbi:MAG: glycosyltransferase [Actinomycetota bacterium]|nr:glycosyltransferase [Actinomycetota bacterium]
MALTTAAVIPARDEAATLPQTLHALLEAVHPSRIIVADDGSRDATPDLSRRLGAEVISASPPGKRGGKGSALRLGLLEARKSGPDAVLLADADLGTSARLLAALLVALDESHPAAVAAFPPATSGGFGLVKRFARREISRRTGYAPSEPLSGQRALLTPALDALQHGIAPGFGAEVGMTLDLLSAGIKPLEIPLPLTHRPTGRGLPGFAHRGRQGLDVIRALQGARIPW